jgi:hypothetical protein
LIARAVVCHYTLDPDAELGIISNGGFKEGDCALLALIDPNLHERDPRGIVDADVDELPTDAVVTVDRARISPGDAVAHRADPAELFDIEMDELAWSLAFITPDWFSRLQGTELVQPQPTQTANADPTILLGSLRNVFSPKFLSWPMSARFIMTSESSVSRLTAPLIALFMTFAAMHAPVHAAEDFRKVTVVSFGLFGDQGVFRREATGAAQVIGSRFGQGSVVVRFNTKKGGGATVEALAATLNAEAKMMNSESDILFLILTSHGSPDGLAVTAGRRTEILKPSTLAEMLDHTGVRHKVVIISACYSGVFIPRLANADTLVITAADADHASFGCEDKAKWTYFGDAFFNIALRQTKTLKDAFLLARTLVSNRELQEGFDPSHPQMAGGANVESLLVVRP